LNESCGDRIPKKNGNRGGGVQRQTHVVHSHTKREDEKGKENIVDYLSHCVTRPHKDNHCQKGGGEIWRKWKVEYLTLEKRG